MEGAPKKLRRSRVRGRCRIRHRAGLPLPCYTVHVVGKTLRLDRYRVRTVAQCGGAAALVALLLNGGCGGVVVTDGKGVGGQGDDSGYGGDGGDGFGGDGFGGDGFGGDGGTSRGGTSRGGRAPSTGGKVSPPPPPSCGNGIIDPGEQCDGRGVLDGYTCAELTMGSKPYGNVICQKCQVSTARCTSDSGAGGAPGTGGMPNGAAGGPTGPAECFDQGGVPDPNNPGLCTVGPSAVNSCNYYTRAVWGTSLGADPCELACGCNACAAAMSECVFDGGCTWLYACAQSSGCTTFAECNLESTCMQMIEQSGGTASAGARIFRRVLACETRADCWYTGCAL